MRLDMPADAGHDHLISARRFQTRSLRERRLALAGTAIVHVGIAAALIINFAHVPVAKITATPTLTMIDLGNGLPAGDPTGDDAPPKPSDKPVKEKPATDKATKKPPVELPPIQLPSEISDVEDASQDADDPASAAEFAAMQGNGVVRFGANTHGNGAGLDGDLAAAIGQAIATQISACWTAPRTNLPDDLAIIMTLNFAADGSLIGGPSISRLRNDTAETVFLPDAYERAAMAAAERCSPIKLPAGLYRYWQSVDVQIFSSIPVEENQPQPVDQAAT